jgi:uncharacterized protein (DUF302 family)
MGSANQREASLRDVTSTERAIQIEHVTMRSSKPFVTVKANLERLVPKLDEGIFQLVANGKIERFKQKLEEGPELAIFLFRDHGGLLKTIGRVNKAVQYEIGNPLTASKMTRHQLAAGLYAPLRVMLYEDETGGSIFEYDKPSSLFGQFDDERVTVVARGLDVALERALQRAME